MRQGRWDSRGSRAWLAAAIAGMGCLGASAPARAGAWTLEKGRALVIVGAQGSRASNGYDADRRSGAIPAFRKAEIQALAEYGVSDRFTLRGRSEFRDVRQEGGEPERRTGLGFSEIGGRYRLVQRGGFVGSVEANLRIAKAEDIVDPEQAGLLEGEYEGRLLAGYGFTLRGKAAFVDGQAAYRVRAADRPDEIKLDATFGIRPTPRVLALAQVFSTLSVGSAPGVDGYDYHKLQLSAVYDASERISLQLGGFTTLAGRNALAEDGIVTAIWLRF